MHGPLELMLESQEDKSPSILLACMRRSAGKDTKWSPAAGTVSSKDTKSHSLDCRAAKICPSASGGAGSSLQERVLAAPITLIANQPGCVASWWVFNPLLSCCRFCFPSGSFGSPVILCSACVILYKLELLSAGIEADKC